MQPLLQALHVGDHDVERGVGKGDGQQVVRMHRGGTGAPRRAGERRMVAHPHRVDALDEPGEPVEMPGVEPGGRAERQPDAVQAHRVPFARGVQHRKRRAAIGKKVLGMDFDEAEPGRVAQHRVVVRLAQADANAARA